MSLTPASFLFTALGSRLGVRSFVQLKLTKNCHLCQFRSSSRNFWSSSALLCRSPKEEGWQQWHTSVPAFQQQHSSELSKGKRSGVIIRDSDTPLVKQIINFQGAAELLEFVESVDPHLVDERFCDITSRCLFNFAMAEKSAAVKKNILNSIGMQKFCRLFKKQSRYIEPTSLISMCKVFSILNTPGTHPTFQIVLRLLSKHANTLPIGQIIYMDFLMEKLDPISRSPLSEALTLALPIIFEGQLKVQLDPSNVYSLVECLQYVVKYDLSGNAMQIVIDAIMKNPNMIKESEAFNILWLLGQFKQPIPEAEPFIRFLFKTVTTNLNTFSPKRIVSLIRKCAKAYVQGGSPYWYNEDFVESACHRLVECGDDEANISCFKSLSLLRHVNLDFMESVVAYVLRDPTVLLNNDQLYFSTLRGLSITACKPEKWNILRPMLVEHPALTKDLGTHGVSVVLDFLALDVLVPNLVEKIFSPENVHNMLNWEKRNGYFSLLLILSAIRHLHPEYNGPLPAPELVREWEVHSRTTMAGSNTRRSLEAAIQSGLGGSAYVMTDIFERGIFIAHGVIIDQDGQPIAVQDTASPNLGDIEKPPNSSLVLIQVYGPEAYAANTNVLRGMSIVQSKILKSYGYPLLEVELMRWKELDDYEKIPWLVQKIREKANNSY